uniref:DIX domain-containing protein n=1 Tax=Parastrongyloides trichosuri TaxID=131310 RepID=A0A0N4Z352_PARTI
MNILKNHLATLNTTEELKGEVVNAKILREIMPIFVKSKNRSETRKILKNEENVDYTIVPNSEAKQTEQNIPQLNIYEEKLPKHLSNGYYTYKENGVLDRLIERKYAEVNEANKIKKKNVMKKSFKNTYHNLKDLHNKRTAKISYNFNTSMNSTITSTENKNVLTTTLKVTNLLSTTTITPKITSFKTPTLENNINHMINENGYRIPESPQFIPQRPIETKHYSNVKHKAFPYKNSTKSDYDKLFYKQKSSTIFYTTPTPIITPTLYMNHAPMIMQPINNNISKQKPHIELNKNNLQMNKENCSKMHYMSKSFGIIDVQKWIRNNCAFARIYLPQATCEELYIFVDSCFKKFFS